MLQRQHSQFNSPCKYTEMNTGCQIFFADISRFCRIPASRGYPLHIMAELVMCEQILKKKRPGSEWAFRGVGCFLWMGWIQESGSLPVIRLV